MLLCPARPVIRSASRQTLEVPVDAKLFGVCLIDGYDFRFYLDLLSGTSSSRIKLSACISSKGVPFTITVLADLLYVT